MPTKHAAPVREFEMAASHRRSWSQFSLRTFLAATLIIGGAAAYLGRARRIYQDEQRLIAELSEQASSSQVVSVVTNGTASSPGPMVFM